MPKRLASLRHALAASTLLAAASGCDSAESPREEAASAPLSVRHPIRFGDALDRASFDARRAHATTTDDQWPAVTRRGDASWFTFDEEGRPLGGADGGWDGRLDAAHSAVWMASIPGPGRYRLTVEAQHPPLPDDAPSAGFHAARVGHIPTHRRTPTLTKLFAWAGHRGALEGVETRVDDRVRWTFTFDHPGEGGDDSRAVALAWNGKGQPGQVQVTELALAAQPAADRVRGQRVVLRRHTLFQEHRPSIVLPRDTDLQWEIDVPAGASELHTAFGLLPEPHEAWGTQPTDITIACGVDGAFTPLTQCALHPGQRLLDHGWRDTTVSLAEYEGRRVTLRISSETNGTDLTVVAEPMLAPTPAPATPFAPPVIVISADTLRPDRMSCYGGAEGITRSLDAFAADGVRFDRAYSTSSFTLPSHASMLSGQQPFTHGINRNPMTRATEQTGFLAEFLREHGYVTAGYTGGGFLAASFGFARGFDRYSEYDLLTTEGDRRLDLIPRPGAPAFNRQWREAHGLDQALAFVEAHRARPFFLFLHTFLVHGYTPSEEALDAVDPGRLRSGGLTASPPTVLNIEHRDARPRDPEELERLRALYDATLWMLDQEMGRFFDELRRLDVFDRAIIVFTSDHGEEFGEHLGLGHGRTLYEETVRVPLIVRLPGGARGVVVSSPVWLPDVVPTILEAVGAPEAPTQVDGRSLRPLMASEPSDSRAVLLETRCQLPWERYALLTESEKIIWNAAQGSDDDDFEWYDLSADPEESRSLVTSNPEEFRRRRAQLEAALAHERARAAGTQANPDERLLEELQRLGYAIDGG